MIEEAAVFRCQNRLDQRIRQLVDRHGILVNDAAMADLVAVAIQERDGEIALRPPVSLGVFKGGKGERQHQHGTGRAPGHAFAEHLENCPFPTAYAKAAEEDGDILPPDAEPETGIPDGGIDPRIDAQQDMALSRTGVRRRAVFRVCAVVLAWILQRDRILVASSSTAPCILRRSEVRCSVLYRLHDFILKPVSASGFMQGRYLHGPGFYSTPISIMSLKKPAMFCKIVAEIQQMEELSAWANSPSGRQKRWPR